MHEVPFRGGTYDGKGRRFGAEPAGVLVVPIGDGAFERYRRSGDTAAGGALVYQFVERFEGDK
jgi:hypothetical protein